MGKIVRTIVGVWLMFIAGWVGMGWYMNLKINNNINLLDPLRGYLFGEELPTAVPTTSLGVSVKPTIKVPAAVKTTPKAVGDTRPWGIAFPVDEHTWTMRVGMDNKMSTPAEILKTLNDYRSRRGSQPLTWDNSLGTYAQGRASYLNKIKSTDGHKGFIDFLENQNGYDQLGFTWLGENISYGYQLEAVHLIEWMYAGDKPHDDNQVNNRWDHVGIGVEGTATCLIFATGKM